MKKKVKIPVIVVSSVVGALLIAVIVLCSVSVRPLKPFMDYETVYVYTSGTEEKLPDGQFRADLDGVNREKLNKNLKKAGFSVMHATLEFVGSYGPKFVKETNDEGERVYKELTFAQARAACAAGESSYMLEFVFENPNGQTPKTFKVGKTEIKYDRMLMNAHTTNGELQWVTVYLFEKKMEDANNPDAKEYRIRPIRMRMNTSPLYIALGEIAADYTA